MATRRYEQRLRAEEAERTRRRILDALRERLREAPAEPVSMNQIARMARVARSTVYLVFGSRPGLFGALGADIMDRGGFGAVPESAACPDAAASLRDGIRAVVGMYASQRDVLRALHSMAQLDAEGVGGSVQKLAQGRATGMAARARLLAEQGALRPDVNEAQAADLLWLLTSFDSFDALYTGRSLPAEQVAEMLIAAAERTLCGAGGFAEAGREGGHDPFGIITGAVETAVRSVLYPGAERAAQGRGGQRGADR